ncbi:MAG: hypothetical protein COB50_05430 [Thiotrichales bacterium]|nr:MAG: hypothetical protein COB50_05430 [Thiotrichales bacterium]
MQKLPWLLLPIFMLCSTMAVAKNVSQINRYTTIKNTPSAAEINPLLAIAIFKFPARITTVGQAMRQVLLHTGYRLAKHLSPDVKQTLKKPLPLTNVTLGPMPIKAALLVLMGKEVYLMQRDPLHRLINFKLKPSFTHAFRGISCITKKKHQLLRPLYNLPKIG